MKPDISIIIPAYNETENLKNNNLEKVYLYLKKSDYSFELILVDDGSTDKTLILLKQFKADKKEVLVLAEPHRGKAGTVKEGMLSSSGKFRLYTDFDQSTPIEEIEKILPFFERGYDVVIGSREVQGAVRDKEPWYRHIMGKGFNFVVQLLAVRGIHDTQCGFKMFTKAATEALFPKLKATIVPKKHAFTGAFDVELLFLAKRSRLSIAEVPVKWSHVKSERVNPIYDSLRMFWQLIQIRMTAIMGGYD